MKRKTKSAIIIIVIMGIFGGIFGYIKFTEQMEKPVPEKEKAAVGYVETTPNEKKEKEATVKPDANIEPANNVFAIIPIL
ncbi:hypothetical protein [Lysinibacillus sp. TE18511]